MRKSTIIFMTLILSIGLIACAKPAPAPSPTPAPVPSPAPAPTPTPTAPAEPIVWKLLSWVAKTSVGQVDPTLMFIDRVNETLKGKFEIKFAGGPEVISQFDVYKAVVAGVAEIGAVSSGYFPDILTEAAMYSNLTHEEIKKTGYYGLLDELHKTKGLKFIGQEEHRGTYFIFTNFTVNKLEDFKGKKIRVFEATIPIAQAVEAVPVTMAMTEVYSAMERGVVDGWVKGMVGVVPQWHWDEVTKYMIAPGAYSSIINLVGNLGAWNKLPQDVRDGINKAWEEVEPNIAVWAKEKEAKEWQEIKGSKIQIIELPPAEAEKFLKRAYDLAWEKLTKQNTELAAKVKAMLVKF
ncbi:MAG: TRAP transporter substrate-binding protein DctP [Chloroflexi bacterium]|nr:TRAP transporter substrate-binding protein DctP [Chloroflexota bacterium]